MISNLLFVRLTPGQTAKRPALHRSFSFIQGISSSLQCDSFRGPQFSWPTVSWRLHP
jgi:hypothetical protein